MRKPKFYLLVVLLVFIVIFLACAGCKSNGISTSPESITSQICTYIHWAEPVMVDDQESTEEAIPLMAGIHVFDRHGNPITDQDFYPSRSEWNYEYDTDGNIIKIDLAYKQGLILISIQCEYDNEGRVVNTVTFTESGWQNGWEYKREYNTIGSLSNSYVYDQEGSLKYEFVYTYDKSGNVIEILGIDPAGVVKTKEEYQYDNEGNKIGKTKYIERDGELKLSQITGFDNQGNETGGISYNLDDGSPQVKDTFNYVEYDQKGNWTKRFKVLEYLYSTDRPPDQWIEYRTIEYYTD
ncbi:MAG: hypothetical protein GY845_11430 [Planctomycetes bacterium]|nr:hypothetical protein [Planctomycetota bacterium]